MLRLAIAGLLYFLMVPHSGAEEQWASRVIKFSSQYGEKQYAARQVLGKPNALDYGRNPVAWMPEAPNLGTEYLEVGFDRPMRIRQVAVAENFNPGAIYQIYLTDKQGKAYKVYEKSQPDKVPPRTRMFRFMMQPTPYEVHSVRIVLNTAGVYGHNQLDAIGISTSDEPMQAVINDPRDVAFKDKPENLGPLVNSADPDMLPFISADGRTLYFARKQHEGNIGPDKNDDIYISHLDGRGKWEAAYNIGPPLNNAYNNFVCAVNPDGTELLLSGRYENKGVAREGLHRTVFNGKAWSHPEPIEIDQYRNTSPFVCYHVSADMKYLVIAMEHPDTYGDMDIYVSFRQPSGRYSKPLNLGPVINTAGTEPSVFLSADGKTIYFASDGHAGYGAYDMFMSRRLDNSWTNWAEPVNLGPGINTPDWDLYYTVPASGEFAYYSSEYNSLGRSDLYRVRLPQDVRPEPVAVVKPSFVNVKTQEPIAPVNSKQAIVLNEKSEVNLYENVRGYYPVNVSKDRSADLEEVDDFGTGDKRKKNDKEDAVLDERMEDLLARLQELKNEQAATETRIEEAEEVPAPADRTAASPAPSTAVYTSELDDRLAALRSDMERIAQGEQAEYSYEREPGEKTYSVKPAGKRELEAVEAEKGYLEERRNYRTGMEEQQDALESYSRQPGATIPTSRPISQYDLRAGGEDKFTEEYQTYRDQLDALKANLETAAYTPQPLTKYALARTAIDETKSRELQTATLKSELDQVRGREDLRVQEVNPEVAAYQRKLEELKSQPDPADLRSETKPVKREGENNPAANRPEEESVTAMRQKLEEIREKMNRMPSAGPVAGTEGTGVDRGATPPAGQGPVAAEPVKAEAVEAAVVETKTVEPEAPEQMVVARDEAAPQTRDEAAPQTAEIPDAAETATTKAATQLEAAAAPVTAPENEALALAEKAVEQARLDKEALEVERERLASENAAMEAQRAELQAILDQMEAERTRFMAEQEKLEKERRQLETLRLEQHKQVKALEREIAELEKSKQQVTAAVPQPAAGQPAGGLPEGEIFLMPLEVGVTVEIRNVFFNANSAYIKPQSYDELDKVAAFLKVNANISVEIGGHTNGLCDDEFCNALSQKRADSVKEYLISRGVATDRLDARGYGKTMPLADNSTDEGRRKNQRVELKILEVR